MDEKEEIRGVSEFLLLIEEEGEEGEEAGVELQLKLLSRHIFSGKVPAVSLDGTKGYMVPAENAPLRTGDEFTVPEDSVIPLPDWTEIIDEILPDRDTIIQEVLHHFWRSGAHSVNSMHSQDVAKRLTAYTISMKKR